METTHTINIDQVRANYKTQLSKAFAEKNEIEYAYFLEKYLCIVEEQNKLTQKLLDENEKKYNYLFGVAKSRNCLKVISKI